MESYKIPETSSESLTILSVLAHHKKSLWGIGLFTAVINLLMLAPAIYMLQVYDRVLASANTMTLLMLTILVLGIFVFIGLLEWIRSAIVIRLGTRIDMQLNQRVFNAAFSSQLVGHKTPAAQALNDLTSLRQFATGNALFAFFDAPWFPLYLLVIFVLHPWLGVLAASGACVLIFLAWLNQWVCKKSLKEASTITSQATQQANANLRNADAIEAMGMLDALRRRWLVQHSHFLYQQNIASDKSSQVTAASKSSRHALQSMMLGLGALLVIDGAITAGVMIAGSILIGRVLGPIDQLIAVWKQWSQARLSYQRLAHLLAEHPPVPAGMVLSAPIGKLSVIQLTVCKPGTHIPILYSINFELHPGNILGVLGPSGSGKSTLAKLLVACKPAFSGSVRLDSANISQWDKAHLGQFIGYLPQDIQLFRGSIAENIARFGTIDTVKVIAAAQMAGVHDLILHLPCGYDSQLGEGGEALSGGQRQRIALARAMYGVPRLIVLDEPNANLDKEGEKALLESIIRLKQQGCTIVMITHKPELLSDSDYLLLLNKGRVELFDRTATVLQQIKGQEKPPVKDEVKAPASKKSWNSGISYGAVPARTASQKS
ncbi:type I secretion system ATPase family protein [Yersinia rochesterensis]|uniref:Type I secretion system ATPase family protein n=1 Tax=Yersinia rochesterensis TaxID=1604335 RepID=A0A8D4N0A5_9GAMM|nr:MULTISPECIES: type I secretion system permease/ATPase [Yersinia]AJI85761.1 type I secretion system ATPase family protein [Yersinia frederiksenii Y225]CRY65782.1 ABC transporter [Yersinia kristensenii]AIN17227.1 type I secretion system ATPase family protein [Yersinia rochesterensis]AJJ35804.1 type I secretion system ATPase family protein [Yersinia rochesterensis]AYD42412.1 type I secretion system permease/ATPase [Yersinia rochesterensis]